MSRRRSQNAVVEMSSFTIDDNDDENEYDFENEAFNDEPGHTRQQQQLTLEPFEIDNDSDNSSEPIMFLRRTEENVKEHHSHWMMRTTATIIPAITVVTCLVVEVPILLVIIWTVLDWIGSPAAWWAVTPLATHLLLVTSVAAKWQRQQQTKPTRRRNRCAAAGTAVVPNPCSFAVSSVLDIILFGYVYGQVLCGEENGVIPALFVEPDGTIVNEYEATVYRLRLLTRLGWFVAGIRTIAILLVVAVFLRVSVCGSNFCCRFGNDRCQRRRHGGPEFASLPQQGSDEEEENNNHQNTMGYSHQRRHGIVGTAVAAVRPVLVTAVADATALLAVGSFVLWMVCFCSVVLHFGIVAVAPTTLSNTATGGGGCNPLDTTECWLPFPSFHQMIPDKTTPTGWRVNLQGPLLPPLKGILPVMGRWRQQHHFGWNQNNNQIDPSFWNSQYDGFATMGPLLFYLDGLKEAHEAGSSQLPGPGSIADSVTSQSVTLLLDVTDAKLVPHSAEIDYLDPLNPLVMVFPAQPLKHGSHYALAVVNATDHRGVRLPPTEGLQNLLFRNGDSNDEEYDHSGDPNHLDRIDHDILPALRRAAPWLDNNDDNSSKNKFRIIANDPGTLQLVFDFVTASAESQLGPVRAVRDATLRHMRRDDDNNHFGGVRVHRILDHDCELEGTLIARTVHAELDVPWFLQQPKQRDGRLGRSNSRRGALLDGAAVRSGNPTAVGGAKFLVQIPCSVRAAALASTSGAASKAAGKPVRAILDFGHGLFYNRNEATERHHQQLAHDEGYVITSMDWRGMSSFDMLQVAKMLLSQPGGFHVAHDNLIQGYANKFALQEFCETRLLSMDWFQFRSSSPQGRGGHGESLHTAPTLDGRRPTQIFYGISQGGILGAGYTALSGPTALDRSILGSPGTPFALVMSRSGKFESYDKLMLLNLYNNRHVRLVLALFQMGWDSVEGSGVLGRPVVEPIPRVLIQTGLGDSIVPTIAAEALARGFGAFILPNNPRKVYGLPTAPAANSTWNGPNASLTELLFEEEYSALPIDDVFATPNDIHYCVRRDAALIAQIAEFVNTGRVTDACLNDGCYRAISTCN